MLCPHCNKVKRYAARIHEAGAEVEAPKKGDFSICAGCGAWSVFGDDGELRAATVEELGRIRRDPWARELERRWSQAVRGRRTCH